MARDGLQNYKTKFIQTTTTCTINKHYRRVEKPYEQIRHSRPKGDQDRRSGPLFCTAENRPSQANQAFASEPLSAKAQRSPESSKRATYTYTSPTSKSTTSNSRAQRTLTSRTRTDNNTFIYPTQKTSNKRVYSLVDLAKLID